MGQIKDITKYPIKASPAAGDTVIGSDNAAGGATVQFDVTNFGAGGSVDDDNLIKLIDFGKVLIGDFGENEFTGVASKVNSLDSISATFTDIVVIKGIVYDSTGSFIATYLVNNYGKGNYGTGGITLVDTDLIRIEKEFITQFPDTSTDVNAVVYDLGEIGATTVSDAVNLLDPSVVIALGENWYFEYTNGGTRYLYGFDGAVGTYGLNDTLTTDADFFLVYDGTIPTSITKTSDLVNDGSDATSTYVETDELATVAFTGNYSDLTGAPSSASGLEAVDEGTGIGYRIIGFDPLNYGNIGLGSVDFGQNTAPSATFGTKGLYGLNFGNDNIQTAGQYYNFTSGVNNITGNSYGWAHGQGNQATEFMSYAWGWENTVPDPYSMTFGVFNNIQDFYSGAVGLGLDVQSPHSFFVGTGNTIYANTTINQADTRLFGVGNGSVLAGTPNTVDVRSDAFLVYWDGRVVAPSLSVADIDGESTGFVLTTREWIEAQSFTSIVASETAAAQRLFVGTGAGVTNSGTATVAIGHSAMNASGVASQDTALGVESLYNLITGNDNVAVGYTAGKFLNSVVALTNATQSVFIGSDTRSLADSQTNEIVIGYGGRGNGSNTATIGNASLTDIYTSANIIVYDAANDANPLTALGASAAERLTIQSVYDSGAQTLDYVEFKTYTASATADKGKYRFLVDETLVAEITDSGIVSSGITRTAGYTVAGLPAGTQGDRAFVTDATAPTFLGVLTGGGAVVTPVFHNGTAWVSA